jgi:cation transport ATPase
VYSSDIALHGEDTLEIRHLAHFPGLGVQGSFHFEEVDLHMAIGSESFMESIGVSVFTSSLVLKAPKKASHAVYISINDTLTGIVTYSDTTKADARHTISLLKTQGINVGLMTGDTPASASVLAHAVGIPSTWVWSAQKPIDKAHVLDSLALEYGPVAMVGDNLNDIPALSSAAFSICVSRDSEISTAIQGDAQLFPTSDETGSRGGSGDLLRVPFLLGLAKETLRTVRQNLVWAIGYNVVALLLSSGLLGLVDERLVLTPYVSFPRLDLNHWLTSTRSRAMASLGMGLSSMFVLMNSMRLEHWVPKDTKVAVKKKEARMSLS